MTAFSFVGCYCPRCQTPIIQPDRCEWQLCEACAKACTHQAVFGLIKKNGRMQFGMYCRKCGLHQ